jgi:hypothetical protein
MGELSPELAAIKIQRRHLTLPYRSGNKPGKYIFSLGDKIILNQKTPWQHPSNCPVFATNDQSSQIHNVIARFSLFYWKKFLLKSERGKLGNWKLE